MASTETPTTSKKVAVKEMSWDPITRIVGSLGIHTEIDFDAKKVEKAYSTSMISRCSVFAGARRSTRSPGLAFIRALARGERQLM